MSLKTTREHKPAFCRWWNLVVDWAWLDTKILATTIWHLSPQNPLHHNSSNIPQDSPNSLISHPNSTHQIFLLYLIPHPPHQIISRSHIPPPLRHPCIPISHTQNDLTDSTLLIWQNPPTSIKRQSQSHTHWESPIYSFPRPLMIQDMHFMVAYARTPLQNL